MMSPASLLIRTILVLGAIAIYVAGSPASPQQSLVSDTVASARRVTAGPDTAVPRSGAVVRSDTVRDAVVERPDSSRADAPAPPDRVVPPAHVSAPVLFAGDTLFLVHSPLGEFVAQERSEQISTKLRALARMSSSLDSLVSVHGEGVTDVLLDTLRVFSVTSLDAAMEGMDRDSLAAARIEHVKRAVRERRSELSFQALLRDAGVILLVLVLAVAAFWIMGKVFPRVESIVRGFEGKLFRSIVVRGRTILKAQSVTGFAVTLVNGLHLVLTLAVLYFALSTILGILPWTRDWDPGPLLRGLLWTVLVTVAALALLRAGRAFFRHAEGAVEGWRGKYIRPIRFRTVEVMSEERLAGFARSGVRVGRFAAGVFLLYVYATVVFSFFDFSRTWAATLLEYVLSPVNSLVAGFINYLPSLFFILVVIVATRYLIKLIRVIFAEVGKGTISFPGFHRDWADPTFKIVRFLVFWFAAVVILPYLPGSDSPAFQGVTVFLGVLFSLGSSSAIANIVAGVVLTYMRPFKLGDRVKIADTMGDVVEKTLLVTRVRTIKNVDISIPNAMVLGSHIINFSSSASDLGLVLHTSVTIGYDVPWRKVHELLIASAGATTNLLKEPKPFVFQTSLDDFYVSYELNAFTDRPNVMAGIYSELHQHIQDRFNEAGVEIMSPHYAAVRDGNQVTIPETYLPRTYQAPGFRLFPLNIPSTGGSASSSPKDPAAPKGGQG